MVHRLTENQGVPSSNLGLGTNPPFRVREHTLTSLGRPARRDPDNRLPLDARGPTAVAGVGVRRRPPIQALGRGQASGGAEEPAVKPAHFRAARFHESLKTVRASSPASLSSCPT